MNEAVSILPVRVVSKAHEGYLRAGVRLGAGVNEITVSPAQLAAMEADPRLVVTVLAAPDHIDADDDAKKEGALDSLLDGSGVVITAQPDLGADGDKNDVVSKELPPPIASHYAPVIGEPEPATAKTAGRKGAKAKAED